MPCFFSATHLPSPSYSTTFDHHPVSSPPVSRDMMRPSDPLSVTLPTSIWTRPPGPTLPVKSGRLGFRSSVQLAPSALMTSAAANFDLTTHTLPPCFQSTYLPYVAEATKCGQWVFTYPPVWSCFPLSEGLWHPQSFCHGHHPAEASPRCCVPLPPSASLNERV